jgi:hypothetical protein
MTKLPFRLTRYLLGSLLAVTVLSNCFDVVSGSNPLVRSTTNGRSAIEMDSQGPGVLIRGDEKIALRSESPADSLNFTGRNPLSIPSAEFLAWASAPRSLAAPVPTITATKSHMLSGPTANPGDTITYTVVISNSGTDATGVSFSDMIDPNTTLVAGSVLVSPIATDDTYNTIGNVDIQVPVAQGVIANDLNPNGSGTLTVTQVNSTAVPGGGSAAAATTNGSVTMNSDGSFSYSPNAGFHGPTDSFTYTLDNGTGKTDTGTVTVNISGLIWFVNAAAGAGGNGTLSNPFNCLVGTGCFDPTAADAANDAIFLYSGSYTGGLTLLTGQLLIGQGASQSILQITGFSTPSGTNLLPATGGTNPTITTAAASTNGVTLGSNNQIWGTTFGNTTGAGISGGAVGTLKVRDTTINGTGAALIISTSGTLDAIFQNISSTNSPTTAFNLTGVGGTFSVTGTTSVTTSAGIGILIQTLAVGATVSLGPTTVNGTGAGQAGVSLVNDSGTITMSATSSITNAGGTAFNVNGGTPGVTFAGNIVQNSAQRVVNIDGTTGGSVHFSGGTVTGGASSTGVNINNANSTTQFAALTLGTSGSRINNQAVTITNGSAGVTYDLGTVSIFTNNVPGIVSTNFNGDLRTATGTVDSGTATAINISGPGGLTSLDITLISVTSSGGTATGIIIQNTNGSFTVIGDNANNTKGGNGTGGTIANKDDGGTDGVGTIGTGVFLNNATNVSLRRMQMHDFKNFGIRGLSVTGFTLQFSTINGANGDDAGTDEGIIKFGTPNPGGANGLLGSGTIDNCILTGGIENNLQFYNVSGNLNPLTVSNSDIKSNSAALGNDGVEIESESTASMTVSIQSCAFDDNKSQPVHASAIDSSTLDITINNCTLQRSTQGNEGFVLQNASNGHLTAHVTNNTSTGIGGVVVFVGNTAANASSASSLSAVISGNNITHPTTALNHAIIAFLSSTVGQVAPSNVLIDNNTIAENSTSGVSRGILVDTPDSSTSPGFTATITNNHVSVGDNVAGLQGIVAQARQASAGCFDIRTNTVTFPNGTPSGVVGIRLRQANTATAQLEQGISSGTPAAVLAANNAASTTEVIGTVTVVSNSTCQVAPTSAPAAFLPAKDSLVESDQDIRVERALVAVRGQRPHTDDVPKLSDRELVWIVQSAIQRWREGGMAEDDLSRLAKAQFEIADLPDGELAEISEAGIRIDETGAGYGWFFDSTPSDDNEFDIVVPDRELHTRQFSPARGKMDLLTVVMRELGHVYLDGKSRMSRTVRPVMENTLPSGVRRVPTFNITEPTTSMSMKPSGSEQRATAGTTPRGKQQTSPAAASIRNAIFNPSELSNGGYAARAKRMGFSKEARRSAGTPAGFSGELVTKSIGTIPAGESVTIMFQVTIDDPFPTGVCDINNAAMITGSNFSPVTSTTDTVTLVSPPVIGTCPTDITTGTDPDLCTAVENFTTPTATGCPVPTVTCVPASGTAFAKGTTTVTCTASSTGGSSNCSFTVTVNDTQPPTASCPANITTNTEPGVCTALVTFTATANDNCPGATVTCTPASGATFAKGVTTVSCTATDASGNPSVSPCTFTVTVNDNEAPVVGPCPANITKGTDPNLCSAVTTFATPAATDNCPGLGAVTCVPASGSAFPKGTTTVTCSVTDASANSGNCQFTVTVNDTQAPSITCPADINVTSNSPIVVTYTTPTPTDNCPGATASCVPASGSTFALGVTTVTCTATDASSNTASCMFTVSVIPCTITCPGNVTTNSDAGLCTAVVTYASPTTTGSCGTITCTPASGSAFPTGTTTVTCSTTAGPSCSFTVTVNDAQPPTITCPANITTGNTPGQCSAVVNFTPTPSDNCPGVTASCVPASGSTFPKGTTTVTCTATDASMNTANCSFTVTVNDTEAPTIACPANIAIGTGAGQCSAVVTYSTPTASDNCPGVGTPVCSPASGSTFPKGTTTVTCTVTDASSNVGSCGFTVTVNDTQPPTITCPGNIAMGTDPNLCSAVVTYAPAATDNCPGVGVVCAPASGSSFPKGITTVTCTATDGSGNMASCSFTVTVNDTQPPAITCPASITAPPGVVNYPAPTATDNCPGVTAACVPPSGSVFGVGITTVTCTATDASANTATCSFFVTTFDVCLQNDSGGATLLFSSTTGDYLFCCGTQVFTGHATVAKKGCTITLTKSGPNVRLSASVDTCQKKGNASLQSPVGVTICTIMDRDTSNNSCQCAPAP